MDNIFGVIGYVPKAEELWKVREAYRSKWEELTKLEKIKTEKESIILEKKKKISIYRDEIEKLTKRKIEGEQLAKFVTFLEKVRSFFHKDCLQKELRIRARPLIERYTREIFDRFNLPYSDLKITDDFNIELYGPHGKETVDMLSGGEKIAAALALRIGIAKALSGRAMELIILDEPTIHLDAQRRQELVEIIRRLSSIPQTIVVTHDKEFEQAADVLIAVEKVNGISTVKQLELILES
jgi:exonuclease SbcC